MTNAGNRVEIATAVLRRHGRVLLCHRSARKLHYPNVWAFPGGNVEAGEAAEQALVRELSEELGIVVPRPWNRPIGVINTDTLHMQTWLIESWSGTPTNTAPNEHDHLIWADLHQTRNLDLAHPGYHALLADLLTELGNTK